MFNHDVLNFRVEKFNLQDVPTDIGVGLRRVDTGQTLAIVSDSYEPVQYLDNVENLEQSINMSGIDLEAAKFETNIINDGMQLELTAKFFAESTTIDGRNDMVTPQFKFRTSHNRTWANNGMMGYFRSACYNTLVDGNKLAYVYGRHSKHFSVPSFASKIRAASDYVANAGINQMHRWYQTPVSRGQAIHLFSNTLAKRMDNVSKKLKPNKVMLSNLMKTFDEENRHIIGKGNYEKYGERTEGTLWTAYQAATAWSTHVPKANTRVLREDKVRKMMDSTQWKELENV